MNLRISFRPNVRFTLIWVCLAALVVQDAAAILPENGGYGAAAADTETVVLHFQRKETPSNDFSAANHDGNFFAPAPRQKPVIQKDKFAYGAIAAGGVGSVFSTNLPTQNAADLEAYNLCSPSIRPACRVYARFVNQCAVVGNFATPSRITLTVAGYSPQGANQFLDGRLAADDFVANCIAAAARIGEVMDRNSCLMSTSGIVDEHAAACDRAACPAGEFFQIPQRGDPFIPGNGPPDATCVAVCDENTIPVSGVCTPCPAGMTANAGDTACECADGTFLDTSNTPATCTPCHASAISNTDRTACICPPDAIHVAFSIPLQCEQCPAGQTRHPTNNIACVFVTCPDGTRRNLGQATGCQDCPTAQTSDPNDETRCINAALTLCERDDEYLPDPTLGRAGCMRCPAGRAGANNRDGPNGCLTCRNLPNPDSFMSIGVPVGNRNGFNYVNPVSGTCEPCQDGAGTDTNDGFCLCTGTVGGVSFMRDGNFGCTACPAGSSGDGNGRFCRCDGFDLNNPSDPNNMVVQNGACRPCPTGATPNFNGSSCNCPANTITPPGGNACMTCPNGEIPNGTRDACICPDTRAVINGICTECTGGRSVNSDGDACVCPAGEFFGSLPGQAPRCLECRGGDPNAERTACICRDTSSFYNTVLQSCATCPTGTDLNDARDACICDDSTERFDFGTGIRGGCVACPAGSSQIGEPSISGRPAGTACRCDDTTMILIGGTCSVCPERMGPDADQTSCVCTGGIGESCEGCTMIANTEVNMARTSCICSMNDQYLRDADATASPPVVSGCVACPTGQTADNAARQLNRCRDASGSLVTPGDATDIGGGFVIDDVTTIPPRPVPATERLDAFPNVCPAF